MQDYPKYSDLMQCIGLSRRLEEIRGELLHGQAIRTGSLIRTESGPHGPGKSITERTALRLLDLEEEQKTKTEEWKSLFYSLRSDIQNGPGAPQEKELIEYYYAFNIGLNQAAKMAGMSRKKAAEIVEAYTRAAYLEEMETRK